MKILIVSSYIFGYMEYLKPALESKGITAEFVYHGKAPLDFKYKSKWHHLVAFIKKTVGFNTKMEFRDRALKSHLSHKSFDSILVIHPQYLANQTHVFLKSITNKYITFLFDSLAKMPRQMSVLHHFDTVFSYEKSDCEKHDFKFLTNFIPVSEKPTTLVKPRYDFFNISTRDERFPKLLNIAKYLKENSIKYEFLVHTKNSKEIEYVKTIKRKIESQEVNCEISQSLGMVDIQREDQTGLSFRVMESLGFEKKLLTTNKDVINYDFYNPNNILVVDLQNILIPEQFLKTPYQKLPPEIYNKYTTTAWVNTVFLEN
ncbi:hypothetical protein [Leeuwenhoekiella sp. MAR_2009_132]|uniref:hypothetical protein n=1 Tax=Leeuwenhoekiella sp. MAR_2009_132 TaxID=1392489 RepID=UPI00048C8D22|nr:hypothetical protein [Leeuwenhoekiella sp. MAR_2009_132]